MIQAVSGNLLFGLVSIGAGVFFFLAAWNAEGGPDDMIFPQVLLGLIVAFGLLLTIVELRSSFTRKIEATISRPSWKSPTAFMLAAVYPVAAFDLGFYFTTLIFLTLVPLFFIRLDRKGQNEEALLRQLAKQAASAAAVTAALYLSFSVVLKFSMPSGLLF